MTDEDFITWLLSKDVTNIDVVTGLTPLAELDAAKLQDKKDTDLLVKGVVDAIVPSRPVDGL